MPPGRRETGEIGNEKRGIQETLSRWRGQRDTRQSLWVHQEDVALQFDGGRLQSEFTVHAVAAKRSWSALKWLGGSHQHDWRWVGSPLSNHSLLHLFRGCHIGDVELRD